MPDAPTDTGASDDALPEATAADPPAIAARGLVKQFGDVRALDGFDIEVDAGTVHGLVGPNGAGKTTFLRVLFDLVSVDEGTIAVHGEVRDPQRDADLDAI